MEASLDGVGERLVSELIAIRACRLATEWVMPLTSEPPVPHVVWSNPIECRLRELFVAACFALDERILTLVREQVLEVTPLKKIGDLKVESYAVWGQVTVVSMELVVFGDIPLGI